MFFGVLLPAGVIIFEASTGFCAETFYSPVPTIWHVLLALCVPAVNLLTWFALTRSIQGRVWIGTTNAFAIGVALYFTLLLAPLLPMGAVAILLFGLGFLPLAPMLSLLVACSQRSSLRSWTIDGRPSPVPGFFKGLIAAVLAVLLVQSPITFTNIGLHLATNGSSLDYERGINLLRQLGSRDQLLRACYTSNLRSDPISWALGFWRQISPSDVQPIFYRVTGQSHLSMTAPRLSRGNFIEDGRGDWDEHLGSDQVGARQAQLSMIDSRLDGIVDADAGVSYLEWIMVFRNDHKWSQREARAMVNLPAGAVVSRCTLWIDGEEREAAFGGREQTKRAYQSVAVQQRRDPLLVTTAGTDRVLVQCFPINPNGAIMKIRIGMTIPMTLKDAEHARFFMPNIAERNFDIATSLNHSTWLTGSYPMTDEGAKLAADHQDGHALRGALSDVELTAGRPIIAKRNASISSVWTDEQVAGQKRRILQEIVTNQNTVPSAIVMVLDLSQPMRKHFADIGKMLAQLPVGTQLAVIGASDSVVDLTSGLQAIGPEMLAILEG